MEKNNRSEIIRERLNLQFSPVFLQVVDESALHAGHNNFTGTTGSHFFIEITASQFTGLSRLAIHRQINEALQDLFAEGLHALRITAKGL